MNYKFTSVNVIGLILFVVGAYIHWVARRTLGKYYTYTLKVLPGHRLVKHGIYKHIRHPCYLAMLSFHTA